MDFDKSVKFRTNLCQILFWGIDLDNGWFWISSEISRNMWLNISATRSRVWTSGRMFQTCDHRFKTCGHMFAIKHAATCLTGSIAYFKRATVCLNWRLHGWNIIWSIIWNIFWITKKYVAAPLKHVVACLNIQLHISNVRLHFWNTKSHQNVLTCHGNFLYPGMKLSKKTLYKKWKRIFNTKCYHKK